MRSLKRSVCAVLVGVATCLAPLGLARAANSGFVARSGRYLALNGKKFYVNGANQYYLWFKPQAMVDEIAQDAHALGLSVIRTWGFCNGTSADGYCFQPQPGVYDESTFRKLDYLIYKANQLDIRLVITLANNWDDFGGMNQYVAWSPTASAHDEFYTDAYSRQLYKDYVRTVLMRINTYTGIEYRNDPTIMMWELANEPRCVTDPTGNTVLAWVTEMSAYIKSLDAHHLVSTGEEGWYTNKGSDWRHNGLEGVDFLRNSQVATVDVASFHLYPKRNAMTESEALAWIDEHAADAHTAIGKPVLLGEFGWEAPREVVGDFSTGAETWKVDFGYRTTPPMRVTSPSKNGNGAISYNTPTSKLQRKATAAGERWLPGNGFDFRSYQTVTGWVYIPSSAPNDMKADLYTKSGSGWTWRDGADVPLTGGAWTGVSITASAIAQPDQVKSVGIRVFNGNTPYDGLIYYDLVTGQSTTPGSTMADRNRIYTDWYNRLNAVDADAAVFWVLDGHQTDTTFYPDYDEFGVYYPEDSATSPVILNYSNIVKSKSTAPAP